MKCQQCEKQSTFHITEITGEGFQEVHLCEDHAKHYLAETAEPAAEANYTVAGALSQQLKLGQTAEELARLDQEACPMCGITFYEFRNQGRLGCPHDYTCFAPQLEPLLINIHGATAHEGKSPKRCQASGADQNVLIRLRREMRDAVKSEDYERASELRDEIETLKRQAEGNA